MGITLLQKFLVAVLVLCISQKGQALQCYICQSLNSTYTAMNYDPSETDGMDHPDCESDPFITNSGISMATCNDSIHNSCFKSIVRYIDFDPWTGERNTIIVEASRLCGHAEMRDQNKCLRYSGRETISHTCYCSTDGCNHAAATSANSLPTLGLALLLTTVKNYL